ncbi:hypothetical protein ACIGO6_15155 [Streptomyces sp. NPDC053750]|uniref:hypothetical protein n=1 Tax=Streptomyces sp. NPDC053750 TaxID=3365714 RepID=UPI0037CCD8F7
MEQRQAKVSHQLVSALVAAGLASALWAAWLGWDQRRDVRPDGSTTGPYEAWQVVGLVLTLLVPVCWAVVRRHAVGPVLGVTVGLTGAAFYDWSDDASGLFVIGVGMVMVGSFVATAVLAAVIESVRRRGGAAAGR